MIHFVIGAQQRLHARAKVFNQISEGSSVELLEGDCTAATKITKFSMHKSS